jgi:hypothetical protein
MQPISPTLAQRQARVETTTLRSDGAICAAIHASAWLFGVI